VAISALWSWKFAFHVASGTFGRVSDFATMYSTPISIAVESPVLKSWQTITGSGETGLHQWCTGGEACPL
jgi:hypothetical protein